MRCERVKLADGSVGYLCGRRPRERRCKAPGCLRVADLLCDGHSEETNPDTAKPDGCDLPICHEHATQIAEDEHLCPRCSTRAREVFEDLRRRCMELGELSYRHELPPVGESWPELHQRAHLLIQERPAPVLWYVGASIYRLPLSAEVRWELEKLPGVLDLALLSSSKADRLCCLACGIPLPVLRGGPGTVRAPPVNQDRPPGGKTFA